MAIMAGLVAAVAIANVLATAATAARLRSRDRANLIAAGATSGQLRIGAIARASITAVLALVIGAPLGWMLQRGLVDSITSSVGVGPGVNPGPSAPALLTGLGLLAALLVGAEVVAAAGRSPYRTRRRPLS
jgi:putative ABC transport system permease protein